MDEGSTVQAHSDSTNLTPLNSLKWDEDKRQSFIESLSAKLNNKWVKFMGYCLEEKINDAVNLLNSSIQERYLRDTEAHADLKLHRNLLGLTRIAKTASA
ncbi:hypothetical protein ElyMa_006877800 [Elysia marginata]|uniref:Uncharacterized protein n=1 Tax=Elysia marginata TaxID=1093978 RepID=A0AAV4JBG2_9GAST|nr:hypothetical protein ElyMa_006877800 [Elysia marginata]